MTRVDNSLLFKRNSAVDFRHVFLIVFSLLLVSIDYNYRYLYILRNIISLTVVPLEHVVSYPTEIYKNAKVNLKNYTALQADNQILRENKLKLEARLQQFQSLLKENNRLRALLKSSPKSDEELTIASLLAVSMDPYQQTLKLAKGGVQHVEIGQPVFDANGVLGQVMRVSPYSSEVLLVTDSRSAIPVVNARNGIRSIAVGMNDMDYMKLLHISNTSNIKVGDLFVSSGMGQRFPEGYPLGIVDSVTQLQGESFAEVLLKPSAQIDRVRFVLLVKSKAQRT